MANDQQHEMIDLFNTDDYIPAATSLVATHATAIEIFGYGIMIIGESGIGKSQLVLELLERGHRLISDDLVGFSLNKTKQVVLTSPNENIRNFIEIRGLGMVNVEKIFGIDSICATSPLFIVIELCNYSEKINFDRLTQLVTEYKILDINFPCYKLITGLNRNLAYLAEIIVRYAIDRNNGYDSHQEFIQKHQHTK